MDGGKFRGIGYLPSENVVEDGKVFLIVVHACLYMKACYEKCRLESRHLQTHCRCSYKVS